MTGLEPAASGVTGRRSNHLSYTPEKEIPSMLEVVAHKGKDSMIVARDTAGDMAGDTASDMAGDTLFCRWSPILLQAKSVCKSAYINLKFSNVASRTQQPACQAMSAAYDCARHC